MLEPLDADRATKGAGLARWCKKEFAGRISRYLPRIVRDKKGGPARLQEGWVIANHILVSFHVAFISSVLALPSLELHKGEVLRFIFASWETLVSALFVYLTFHAGIAFHELGHFLTAARLNALNEDVLDEARRRLAGPWPQRTLYLVGLFAKIPYGRARGIKREGLNYYPDAPFNLAVAAAGPRASRNLAAICLPPAAILIAVGLLLDVAAALYPGRLLLGIGVVGLLDFLLADPGKYAAFRDREREASEKAATVERTTGWLEKARELKNQLTVSRMQSVTHRRLGPVTAPWQFRNCGMGGRHTEKEYPESNISMQEAMFLILCARDYQDAQELTVRLQTRLKEIIEKEEGCRVMGIGLEGGLAPYIERGDFPLPEVRLWAMMKQAIAEVGCRPGIDVAIALDPAMSELEIAYRKEFDMPDAVGMYLFWRDKAQNVLDREGVLEIYVTAMREYEIPILSIEDGFSEHDHEGWKLVLDRLGDDVFVIGDDLVTTNDRTIEICAAKGLINSALIKANQIGTLYETLLAMLVALGKGQELVVSHRSKSPNDDMEAQIALAVNALGLKAGGGANTERLVKYQSVTERLLKVTDDDDTGGALQVGERATVRTIRAYEEPTNAGIPTVGATLELGLAGAGLGIAFRGATPLGTSAGSGEAIHLIDSMIEQAEHREVLNHHGEFFEEVETGVFSFRKGIRPPRIREAKDEALTALFERTQRYGGKGCLNAVDNVTQVIAPLFAGRGVERLTLKAADTALLQLEVHLATRRGKIPADASAEKIVEVMQRKQNLGMNAILSVSLALARAIAHVQGKELYELLREEMLSIIQSLSSAHDVRIEGTSFEDYVAALREVEKVLEGRGEALYAVLRDLTGIYRQDGPELPAREVRDDPAIARPTLPEPSPSETVPVPVPVDGRAPAAAAASSTSMELLSPPLSLTEDEEISLAVLDQQFFATFASTPEEGGLQGTLTEYLRIKSTVASRTGHFGIANNRIYRSNGQLLIPYVARNTIFVHAVKDSGARILATRRFTPGTILTDGYIASITGHSGEVIDLEAPLLALDEADVGEIAIGRIRDMSALIKRINGSTNRNEALYLLRVLVARLCNLPMKAFLGAKNLRPEIHDLTTELALFLDGPHRHQLRGAARVLVRNLSTVVGRPNLIDRLWNDTIGLAEVHVRGSAIVNELRRSSHHALGRRTLLLAEAYLEYLETGDTAALAAQGFESPADADIKARGQERIREVLRQVIEDLKQLLGTSETVARIREWQEAFAEALLRCEFGTSITDELETVVTLGIRERNRWGYAHHLRILLRKASEFALPADVAATFRTALKGIRGLETDDTGFNPDRVEQAARDAVSEFVTGIQAFYQAELFRSLEELLAAYEREEFYPTFLLTRRLRQRVDRMIAQGGYPELRYFLFQLDCLLEEMGYLALRHIATDFQEHEVQLDRCLQIISRCVLNLELDGIPTRELNDVAALLTDPRRTDEELLNTLLHIERLYHKIRRRVSQPYEKMASRLGLDDEELRTVLANMQRYMHDLNSMVSFADVARAHIRSRSMAETAVRTGPHASTREDLSPFQILHLSHRKEVVGAVEGHGDFQPIRDLYGGKGSGLIYIRYLSIPTRDGFILPTHLPRANLHRDDPARVEREIKKHLEILERDLANRSGVAKKFGRPEQPLLLAIRGGSVFSMPGMLATIVFAGINDEIAAALAQDDPWRAYDSYRRFLASYAAAAWRINLEEANLVDAAKARYGVEFKEDLPWKAMKEVAESSKSIIREQGFGEELDEILAEPMQQLYRAVNRVFSSWESENVARYREIKGLCRSWHTAAIVQEMAFGNRVNPLVEPGMDETVASLTGVIPRSANTDLGTRVLEGEIKFSAAGDDLVSGVTASSSIKSIGDLQTLMPTLHRRLDHVAASLRRFMGSDQEVEFTVERGVLSVLQSRSAQTGTDQPPDRFLDPGEPVARGLGIRGGSFRGLVAFDDSDVAEFASLDLASREDVDGIVIIIENPTPEEIPLILSADALITAKGGSTSHAAVAIHGVDDRSMFAVMSVEGLRVEPGGRGAIILDGEDAPRCTIAKGDIVSLHGTSGEVYLGSRVVESKV